MDWSQEVNKRSESEQEQWQAVVTSMSQSMPSIRTSEVQELSQKLGQEIMSTGKKICAREKGNV